LARACIGLACLGAGLGVCPIAGCENKPAKPAKVVAPVATYTVRGIVSALPDPARKGSPDLQLHHEAIPGFKDKDGTVVGMNSMPMPFPLADGVTLEGIALGDKLEVTFLVDWSLAPAHRVTAWKKLPPETELSLRK
jgi:hypothetical protein